MKLRTLIFAVCSFLLIGLTANAQRQFKLKEVESFFFLKKDSVLHILENKGYRQITHEGETYIYQVIDKDINEFQVAVAFKRNDLLAFGWTELSEYCKPVTTEMFESNYFYNGGGEEVNNDKDLAISLVVKPSENRLYLVLKAR